jgi:hypothetical protein
MTGSVGELPHPGGLLIHNDSWSGEIPGRLRSNLAGFERTSGKFRQRRWS